MASSPWPTLLLSESWLLLRSSFFWQRTRYTLARSLRDGVVLPDSHRRLCLSIFSRQRPTTGFALTGVQRSPGDMCSLLLASTREGRRRAAPSRRGQTHFSFQEGLSYPDELYHQQLLLQLALHTETRGRGSRAPSSTRRPTTTRARLHCRRPARRRGQRRRLPRERDIGTIRGGPSIPRSSARRRSGGAYRG